MRMLFLQGFSSVNGFTRRKKSGRSAAQPLADEQGNVRVIAICVICCVLLVLLVLAVIFRDPIGDFLSDISEKYLNFSEIEV